MTAWDKVAWACTWVAPALWLGALLGVVCVVVLGYSPDPVGRMSLWPIGAVLLGAWTAQMILAFHTLLSTTLSRAEKRALFGKLWSGGGYKYWRDLMRARR